MIGGDYVGLGIVRSLGRRGIPVWVLDDELSVALASRYTRRKLRWPRGARAQLGGLLALHAAHGLDGWLLCPTRDETAALIARHHDALATRYTLITPPWAVFQHTYDKRLTYQLAAALDIPHPRTRHGLAADELPRLDLDFPLILKPAIKHLFYQHTRDKAWRIDTPAQLAIQYAAASRLIAPDQSMLQELGPGAGEAQYSFAGLCQDGRVLAWVVARRLRQHPMDFGHASTFVETVVEPRDPPPCQHDGPAPAAARC